MVTGDRGAQIVDLVAVRMARLVRSLEHVLEGGHVIIDVAAVANLDEWRKAVRRIAAARKWRVRTGVTPDGSRVWAIHSIARRRSRIVRCFSIGWGTSALCSGPCPSAGRVSRPRDHGNPGISSQAGATAPRESPLAVRT